MSPAAPHLPGEVERRKAPNPVLLALLVAAVAFAALGRADSDEAPVSAARPEALEIDAVGSAACPVAEARAAAGRGISEERAGTARVQRFAFEAREAGTALRELAEAAACFDRAGRAADADRVRRARRGFVARLGEERDALERTLGLALEGGDTKVALGAAEQLEGLFAGRQGPYVDWLARTRERLEAELRRRAKK